MNVTTIPCQSSPAQATRWLDPLPSAANCLFSYQREQLGRLADAIEQGVCRALLVAPTGSGKTHQISAIAAAAELVGLRVLILATRTRLVRQLHERLEAFGVAHGIRAAAMPGHTNHAASVQVASVDTLYRRCLVDGRAPLPGADVLVFDEGHLATGHSRVAILDAYPHAVRVGFTATPAKVSGRALGEHFDTLIPGPSVRELIALGRLVRPRIFSRPLLSRDELRSVARDSKTNDFTTSSVAPVMGRAKLVGDVIENWLRIAHGKRTLVFACNKAHGQQLTEEFQRVGVAAELLTDETPEPEREAAIARLEAGETSVLINCFLLSYGIDVPSVECISLARPTRSLILYLQMVGRGLRAFPGKDTCIVIDHGRCVETLGLPHEDFAWSLEAGSNVSTAAIAAHGRLQSAEQPRECVECSAFWLVSEEGPACPSCGWQPTPKARGIQTSDAHLAELDTREDTVTPYSPAGRQFFREAIGDYVRLWPDRWRETPNKARGYAWAKSRERFGWPAGTPVPSSYWREEPVPPSKETAGWLQSRRIAYGRSRSAALA